MIHKNHLLAVFKRADADKLNEHMRKFPSCNFVTKDVPSCKARRDDGEKAPSPRNQGTFDTTYTTSPLPVHEVEIA